MTQPLPPEVVELLELAAAHPEGVEPLLQGELESAASLYQVHPRRVDHARSSLANLAPQARDHHLERARSAAEARAHAHHHHARPWVPAPCRDAEAVTAAARALPGGLELLTRGPVEMAAVVLQAHPFVVDEARARLATPAAKES